MAPRVRGAGRGERAGDDAARRGHVVVAPGSAVPSRRFTARVYVLSAREGGRTVGAGTVTVVG